MIAQTPIPLAGYSNTSPPLTVALNISGHGATVYFINTSSISFAVDFGNGNFNHLPNNWARPYKLPASVQHAVLSVKFYPTGITEPLTSFLAVETYLADDDISFLRDGPISG